MILPPKKKGILHASSKLENSFTITAEIVANNAPATQEADKKPLVSPGRTSLCSIK